MEQTRGLMFNMKHYLVNFYQICSNYGTGAKSGPRHGVAIFTLASYRENIKTIFLSETTRPKALIFSTCICSSASICPHRIVIH